MRYGALMFFLYFFILCAAGGFFAVNADAIFTSMGSAFGHAVKAFEEGRR